MAGAAEPALRVESIASEPLNFAFGGRSTAVTLVLRNHSNNEFRAEVSTRVFQLSSATAMPVGETRFWKQIIVLPGQAVLDQVEVNFPDVRAATRFEVRFLSGEQKIGSRVVTVFPTNLIRELAFLAREKPIGIFDPAKVLKPLLEAARVEFEDLEQVGFDRFTGTLAVIGPVPSDYASPRELRKNVTSLVRRGNANAVLLERRPASFPAQSMPTVLGLNEGRTQLVWADTDSIADLANRAQSQWNLIQFARLATTPTLLDLEPVP